MGREREQEDVELAAEDVPEVDEEDDDEEKPIYNPKDVPLGWDGKPIPYWLFRLHGLSKSVRRDLRGSCDWHSPLTCVPPLALVSFNSTTARFATKSTAAGRRSSGTLRCAIRRWRTRQADINRANDAGTLEIGSALPLPQEWKHASMLRRMGIPNTVHFQDVTTVDDALARTCRASAGVPSVCGGPAHSRLTSRRFSVGHAGVAVWEKLKQEKQQVDFKMDQEEEFEDSQGNVMSRKTYEDLRRQGLL